MYSWVNSGSSRVYHLLLLQPSGVSLETAANFFLFLRVAIFLEREKISSAMKTEPISLLFLTDLLSIRV